MGATVLVRARPIQSRGKVSRSINRYQSDVHRTSCWCLSCIGIGMSNLCSAIVQQVVPEWEEWELFRSQLTQISVHFQLFRVLLKLSFVKEVKNEVGNRPSFRPLGMLQSNIRHTRPYLSQKSPLGPGTMAEIIGAGAPHSAQKNQHIFSCFFQGSLTSLKKASPQGGCGNVFGVALFSDSRQPFVMLDTAGAKWQEWIQSEAFMASMSCISGSPDRSAIWKQSVVVHASIISHVHLIGVILWLVSRSKPLRHGLHERPFVAQPSKERWQ